MSVTWLLALLLYLLKPTCKAEYYMCIAFVLHRLHLIRLGFIY